MRSIKLALGSLALALSISGAAYGQTPEKKQLTHWRRRQDRALHLR